MLAKLMILRLKLGLSELLSQYLATSLAITMLAVVFSRMIRSVAAIEKSMVGPAWWIPAQLINIDGLWSSHA